MSLKSDLFMQMKGGQELLLPTHSLLGFIQLIIQIGNQEYFSAIVNSQIKTFNQSVLLTSKI